MYFIYFSVPNLYYFTAYTVVNNTKIHKHLLKFRSNRYQYFNILRIYSGKNKDVHCTAYHYINYPEIINLNINT